LRIGANDHGFADLTRSNTDPLSAISFAAVSTVCPDEGKNEGLTLLKELTGELLSEGRVRELVRQIQEARKKKGLEITDRVRLRVNAAPELQTAIDALRDYITEETLAIGIELTSEFGDDDIAITIDGYSARLVIQRA
jgi:hypothetical protein